MSEAVGASCFWDFLGVFPSPFCEAPLCSWVVEPANTWSNVGFLIAAVAILRTKKVTNRRVKNLFFVATFSLFLGSTFFHLSRTPHGKFLDVGAMFALSMVILTLAVERRFGFSEKKANVFFAIGFALSLVFLGVMKVGNVLFVSELAFAAWFEWKSREGPGGLRGDRIKLAVGVLVLAGAFLIADVVKILCIPDNHVLTGHGAWHLLTALSLWIYFLGYEEKKKGNGPF